MHVKYFYSGYNEKSGDQKTKIVQIACGSNHSMCIDESGQLYIWGEAKLGACGAGNKSTEPFPIMINLYSKPDAQQPEGTIKINEFRKSSSGRDRVVKVSGGFAHTACITESGHIFTWGFNIVGQLGLGDSRTRYTPQLLKKDLLGNQLPSFVNVQCGSNTTYAIDGNSLSESAS